MSSDLLDRLRERAGLSPDAPAILQAETGVAWNWARLWNVSGNLAARLSRAIPAGAGVILAAPNEPAFVAAFVGILRAGCKVFPVAPGSTIPELQAAAAGSKATAIISSEPTIAAMRNFPVSVSLESIDEMFAESGDSDDFLSNRDLSRAAMLLHSSGSTGCPRIVHRNIPSLNAVARACIESVGFGPADRVLAAVPLCHSFGVEHGLLAPLCAGSVVHLCRGFDLRIVLGELQKGITIFPVVPFMVEALAQSEGDANIGAAKIPSLRKIYSAGGPLPAGVAQSFSERFGLLVGQVYGATEIGSVTFSDPRSPGFNPASVGKPMPGVTIKILSETAEVAIKADSMFDGYRDETGAGASIDSRITADGFFLTGDLGGLDSIGNLLITGRLKLLIDIGGKKVNPLEVEQVLAQHPGVAECVVVPMDVSATVTRLRAVVTQRAGTSISPQILRQFAKSRLSAFKVPRVFEVRDSLPRSPAGKILRHLIRG
jgi:acyl-CoA synthetase (AMP-forming)/AMP-acid ligase II